MFNVVSLKRQHKRAVSSEITEVRPIVSRTAEQAQPYFSKFEDCVFLTSARGGDFLYRAQEDFEVVTLAVKGSVSVAHESEPAYQLDRGDIANTLMFAGDGLPISFGPGSEILQVLLKPGMTTALSTRGRKRCSKYNEDIFPVEKREQFTIRRINCSGSPLSLATAGVDMCVFDYERGDFSLILKRNSACFTFALEGHMTLGNQEIHRGDFAMIDSTEEINMSVPERCRLFVLETCMD